MTTELLIFILIALLMMAGAMFLLKSVVKAAILTIIIMVLFRVGWIYSAEEMIGTFRLNQILTEENYENFKIGYDDYVDKREKDPVIDPQGLEDTVKGEIEGKISDYLNPDEEATDN